jgi:transcriptional regulator with XRE-family HTH domain
VTPAETRAVFARRVLRERLALGWSVRGMAARSGGTLSAPTVSRAENGHDVFLSSALSIAGVLGMTLPEMFGPPQCGHCDGRPPAGFACPECERTGAT